MGEDGLITRRRGSFDITNLGAILFAKDIGLFETIRRNAPRVIIYDGSSRIKTKFEKEGTKGYATGYRGLVSYINSQLPMNEEIKQALRTDNRMYPEIAIRELIANALIHQDFSIRGSGPMVEIFNDRIEISNPGKPLISVDRFIDHSPQSRNECIAALMRRIKICEERGSGIDKVIFWIEVFQLPAPMFEVSENSTRVTLFAYKSLREMEKTDKIRACYQHCCLKYVSKEKTTNTSLRNRFKIKNENYSIASRIIGDTIDAKLIKLYDPEKSGSRKHSKYVPIWA
ncbi:MAG: ATP-binding protein [Patescibacteria group bacterium]